MISDYADDWLRILLGFTLAGEICGIPPNLARLIAIDCQGKTH